MSAQDQIAEKLEKIGTVVSEAMKAQDECVEELMCAIENRATRTAIMKIERRLIAAHKHLSFCQKEAEKYLNAYAEYLKEMDSLSAETKQHRTLN